MLFCFAASLVYLSLVCSCAKSTKEPEVWAGVCTSNILIVVEYGQNDFLKGFHAEWPMLTKTHNIISVYILDYGPGDAFPTLIASGMDLTGIVSPSYPRYGATFQPDRLCINFGSDAEFSSSKFLNTENRLSWQRELGDPDIVGLCEALNQSGSFGANYYTMYPVLPEPPTHAPCVSYDSQPVTMLRLASKVTPYDWTDPDRITVPSLKGMIHCSPTPAMHIKQVGEKPLYRFDVRLFDKEVNTATNSLLPIWNRGCTQETAMYYKEAIDDYTEVLRRMPQFAQGLIRRGFAYRTLGKYEQALDNLLKAKTLASDVPGINNVITELQKQIMVTNNPSERRR